MVDAVVEQVESGKRLVHDIGLLRALCAIAFGIQTDKFYRSLFFFSIQLVDKDLGGSYTFFPGTGTVDNMKKNIVNVPMVPLWKVEGNKGSEYPAKQTRGAYGRQAFKQQITHRYTCLSWLQAN